ncbi:MAG: hypothetical protein MK116_06800 [Phycisphaerales bacterium]|nr:hypothetical protein [Phycisphaerales bacterium]
MSDGQSGLSNLGYWVVALAIVIAFKLYTNIPEVWQWVVVGVFVALVLLLRRRDRDPA